MTSTFAPSRKQVYIQTVEENMKFYTPQEVERAKKARSLLAALGTPSIADLKTAIAMNAIAGLPLTTKDVDLAEKIFGPDLGTQDYTLETAASGEGSYSHPTRTL